MDWQNQQRMFMNPGSRNWRYCWFFLIAFVSCAVLAARPGESPANLSTCASFRADANLVTVPVSVFDPQNRLVNHLNSNDFRVFEDGVEQHIVSVGEDDVPVSVGFVFDTSASMGAKLDISRQAIAEFLRSANPEDEFFLLPFDSRPGAVIGFTDRPEEIMALLARSKPYGRTAMLDAIQAAFLNLRKAHHARRALIIVSDGGDNHSRVTHADIRRIVREADVEVFALGTYEPIGVRRRSQEELTGPELLARISDETGGRSFPVQKRSDILDAAIRIGFDLRNQYLIEYHPANQNWNGMYRTIAVEVAPPPGFPRMRVNWRQGYYGAVQPCVAPAS
jgi:Ca-activated chloride channel family protein